MNRSIVSSFEQIRLDQWAERETLVCIGVDGIERCIEIVLDERERVQVTLARFQRTRTRLES